MGELNMELRFDELNIVQGPRQLDPERIEDAIVAGRGGDSSDADLRTLAQELVSLWNTKDHRRRFAHIVYGYKDRAAVVFDEAGVALSYADAVLQDARRLGILSAFGVTWRSGEMKIDFTYRHGYPGRAGDPENPGEDDEVDIDGIEWRIGDEYVDIDGVEFDALVAAGWRNDWWTPDEPDVEPPEHPYLTPDGWGWA
jgi:hypothetical protein